MRRTPLLLLSLVRTTTAFVSPPSHVRSLHSFCSSSTAMSTAMSALPAPHIGSHVTLDPFCFKQFPPPYSPRPSPTFSSTTPQELTKRVDDFIAANGKGGEACLKPGYAPFCKHVFIPNFTEAVVSTLPITPDILPHIRTKYEARTPKELPVLVRYIPLSLVPNVASKSDLPRAKFLDVILYSREQINKESEAMGKAVEMAPDGSPLPGWGIVSIKPQDVEKELPMNPITAMRNALGREYGGSGREILKEEYMEAVAFWDENVVIIAE